MDPSGCNQWLLELPLPFYHLNQSAHSPPTPHINWVFPSTQLLLGGYLLFSDHPLKTLETLKIPVDQHPQAGPSGTDNQPHSKSLKSPFELHTSA